MNNLKGINEQSLLIGERGHSEQHTSLVFELSKGGQVLNGLFLSHGLHTGPNSFQIQIADQKSGFRILILFKRWFL